jgi:hypothetical protein
MISQEKKGERCLSVHDSRDSKLPKRVRAATARLNVAGIKR